MAQIRNHSSAITSWNYIIFKRADSGIFSFFDDSILLFMSKNLQATKPRVDKVNRIQFPQLCDIWQYKKLRRHVPSLHTQRVIFKTLFWPNLTKILQVPKTYHLKQLSGLLKLDICGHGIFIWIWKFKYIINRDSVIVNEKYRTSAIVGAV